MSETDNKEYLYGLLIAAIAFLVYANSLGNGFVVDDHSVILNNPVLRDSPLSLFSRIDTTDENQLLPYYRPLTYLTYQLELHLHNFNPFLVRLANILLHSANASLVYLLARSFFSNRSYALLAALLFALHPLHSEAVDYNSARNTLLSCFFILAAYLVHRKSIIRSSIPPVFFAVILYLAALFSKETSVAILPFILVLEISKLQIKHSGERIRSIIRLLPYMVATLFYFILRWQALSPLGIQNTLLPGINPTEQIQSLYATSDLATRLLQNIYIIPRYLAMVFNPTALSHRYVVPADLFAHWLLLSIAWTCIVAGVVWLLTRGRTAASLFGLAWLILFWLPTCGIIYFPSAPLADRFLYAPAIGLWLIVVDQLQRFIPDSGTIRKRLTIAAVFVLCVLAGLTVKRNMDWKSDTTLNIRMVRQYPENPHGHLFMGSAYIGSNNLEEGEREYKKALELDPTLTSAYTPLGYIRMRMEDFEGALFYYTKALSSSPNDRDALINSALALEKLGRIKEAFEAYKGYIAMPGYNNIPGSLEYAEERVRELSK